MEHKELVEVFTALIAALAAFFAAQARVAARSTDDAVNKRHSKDHPRLYDLALENREAIKKVSEAIDRVDGILQRLERIEKILKNCPYAPGDTKEEIKCPKPV